MDLTEILKSNFEVNKDKCGIFIYRNVYASNNYSEIEIQNNIQKIIPINEKRSFNQTPEDLEIMVTDLARIDEPEKKDYILDNFDVIDFVKMFLFQRYAFDRNIKVIREFILIDEIQLEYYVNNYEIMFLIASNIPCIVKKEDTYIVYKMREFVNKFIKENHKSYK